MCANFMTATVYISYIRKAFVASYINIYRQFFGPKMVAKTQTRSISAILCALVANARITRIHFAHMRIAHGQGECFFVWFLQLVACCRFCFEHIFVRIFFCRTGRVHPRAASLIM